MLLFLAFQAQHALKSSDDEKKGHIRDSQTTNLVFIKLLKITVYVVKKHQAHTTSYGHLVNFAGNDLEEPALKEYLLLIENRKNALHFSTTAVNTFLYLNCMKENTMKIIREHEDFTIMVYEATDESNRSG